MYTFIQNHPKIFVYIKIASFTLSLLLPIIMLIAIFSRPVNPLNMLLSSEKMESILETQATIYDTRDYLLGESDDTTNVPEYYVEFRESWEDARADIESAQETSQHVNDYISGKSDDASGVPSWFAESYDAWKDATSHDQAED